MATASAPDLNRPLEYEDYAEIPSDGRRWEILEGELYVTPPPSTQHQRLSFRLQRQLADYFEPRGAEVFNAPYDLILARHDICQPDLMVANDPAQHSARGLEGAPRLVVEILSPSNRRHDREIKARRYAVNGVAHYWIVDPELRTIDCYRNRAGVWELAGGSSETASVIELADFPGLSVDLERLWR